MLFFHSGHYPAFLNMWISSSVFIPHSLTAARSFCRSLISAFSALNKHISPKNGIAPTLCMFFVSPDWQPQALQGETTALSFYPLNKSLKDLFSYPFSSFFWRTFRERTFKSSWEPQIIAATIPPLWTPWFLRKCFVRHSFSLLFPILPSLSQSFSSVLQYNFCPLHP